MLSILFNTIMPNQYMLEYFYEETIDITLFLLAATAFCDITSSFLDYSYTHACQFCVLTDKVYSLLDQKKK